MDFVELPSGLLVPWSEPPKQKLTIFVDESGWTGTNVADKQQPRVLFAGLAIAGEKIREFSDGVMAKIDGYKNTFAEVKGSNLVKKHRRLAKDILRCCVKFNAVFLGSGVDKLYQVVCMIPHFLHDGAWQPLVHDSPIDARFELLLHEGLRPTHWIEPKYLAAAYWTLLSQNKDVLTDFYRSVWPSSTDDAAVDAVNESLSRVIDVLNRGGELSLADFLSTPLIAREQVQAASAEISKRLGREARMKDIFDAYDRKSDILRTRQDYEPGAVAYGNLLHQADQFFEFFNVINARVRPDQAWIDMRDGFDVGIIQDEPAVCKDVDYQAVYGRVAELARVVGMAAWAKEPLFRKSHETPGLIAADVWAAVVKAMWEAVQKDDTSDWDDIADDIMQLGWFFTDFVAPPSMQEKWSNYQNERLE